MINPGSAWNDALNASINARFGAPAAPAPAPAAPVAPAQPVIPTPIKQNNPVGGTRSANITVGEDQYGFPNLPQFQSIRDASGNLMDQFKLGDSSKWQGMMTGKINDATQSQLQSAAQQQAGANAQAASGLAMRGGLGGGARERMAQAGANALALGQQGIRGSGQKSLWDVATKGEEMNLGARESDVNRLLQDVQGQNLFAKDLYGEELKKKIGLATQAALAGAGGGGGGSSMWSNPLNWNVITALPNAVLSNVDFGKGRTETSIPGLSLPNW
jgi:hypothetical protein